MKGTPYSTRNNETWGSLDEYMRENAGNNDEQIDRLKRNLRLAREKELTPRQRQMMQMRYEENKTVSAIARELGVDKSTVSRTLTRAIARIRKVLKYSL